MVTEKSSTDGSQRCLDFDRHALVYDANMATLLLTIMERSIKFEVTQQLTTWIQPTSGELASAFTSTFM